ncbi:MAG: hypothetical protein K6F86_04040 [Lachnospiraceae bacterium]|nr:hypothetical protein [Lachnospiraceae bacterium]
MKEENRIDNINDDSLAGVSGGVNVFGVEVVEDLHVCPKGHEHPEYTREDGESTMFDPVRRRFLLLAFYCNDCGKWYHIKA